MKQKKIPLFYGKSSLFVDGFTHFRFFSTSNAYFAVFFADTTTIFLADFVLRDPEIIFVSHVLDRTKLEHGQKRTSPFSLKIDFFYKQISIIVFEKYRDRSEITFLKFPRSMKVIGRVEVSNESNENYICVRQCVRTYVRASVQSSDI